MNIGRIGAGHEFKVNKSKEYIIILQKACVVPC